VVLQYVTPLADVMEVVTARAPEIQTARRSVQLLIARALGANIGADTDVELGKIATYITQGPEPIRGANSDEPLAELQRSEPEGTHDLDDVGGVGDVEAL
jgi:hypothetical protein